MIQTRHLIILLAVVGLLAACGDEGTGPVDDGTKWSAVPSGLTREFALNAVWGSGGNDVWVGGDNDHLMHWEQR